MQGGTSAKYDPVADSIQLETETSPGGPDTVEGRAIDSAKKARYWWRGARTRCALRFAPWLACLTALFIFLSESKTAIAAFDAGMKAIARQWSENNTEHEQTFLDDMKQTLRQGLFFYTTHTRDLGNITVDDDEIIKP